MLMELQAREECETNPLLIPDHPPALQHCQEILFRAFENDATSSQVLASQVPRPSCPFVHGKSLSSRVDDANCVHLSPLSMKTFATIWLRI